MTRTGATGLQIQDDSVETQDIKDRTIQKVDLNQEIIDALGPEDGWNDYTIGGLTLQGTGNTTAELEDFIGGIKLPTFVKKSTGWGSSKGFREGFASVHLLHDYKKGTKIYPHVHWSYIDGSKTGDIAWFIEYTYARGYNIDEFANPTTIELIQTAQNPYEHHIVEASELQAIPAITLDTDGVLLVRIYRDAGTGSDTLDADAFVMNIDLHYQSDGYLTTEKNADPITETFTKNIP